MLNAAVFQVHTVVGVIKTFKMQTFHSPAATPAQQSMQAQEKKRAKRQRASKRELI